MKKCGNWWIITCLILLYQLLVYSETYAQTFNARFTTAAYSWQQQVDDSSSAHHVRAYQLAQLTIGNLGLPNLSFHTYFQVSGDFVEEAVDDPRLWIYNCYFKLRNIAQSIDLSIGRQRIYAGVGYGTVDGLRADYHFKDYFKIKFYLGTLAPLRKSYNIESISSDNLTWGFHVTTNKIKKIRLGLSFANFSRIPIKYKSPGIFTGTFRMIHPISSLQKQLLGLDVSSQLTRKITLNGRLDFNLIEENVKRGEMGARYKINKDFEIGLDYIHRMPSIDFNSIFSVFTLNSNREIAFFTNYRWKQYLFFINLATVFFNGDDNLRFAIGCNWKTLYLGYQRRSGYGGDSDGLTANFRYQLKDKIYLSLGSNFASYKLYPSAGSKEQALAGSLGINYNPQKSLSLQAQLQLLTNEHYDYDVRLFCRGSYSFFHRKNK